MPIPQNQLDQLQKDLGGHERRVADLQATLADLNNELQAHNIILILGRNKQLLSALQEIHDHPELAARLKQDPQGFLQARQVQLPAGATIIVSNPTPQSLVLEAQYHTGRFAFGAQWDSAAGFSVRQL